MIKVKKNNLIRVSIVIVLIVIGVIFLILSGNNDTQTTPIENSPIVVGDEQIINLKAKNGYSPNIIEAKANTNSILRINTNNTFDCSLALRIPALGVDQILPISGNTDFRIQPQSVGSVINGTCSMGMYSFKIKFN